VAAARRCRRGRGQPCGRHSWPDPRRASDR
jgi:hypothetical protein